MTTDDLIAAWRLIETGTVVPFRIAGEEVKAGHEQAELGFRIDLVFGRPVTRARESWS